MADSDKKILLIEDDEGFADILKRTFAKTEFSTVFAKDGEEGLEMAKSEKPDLILLDIILPGIDGTQVAAKLKESGANIPIIFLTNVNDPRRISEGIVASGGEADYIVKTDVHVEEIIDRIRKRLASK